MKQDNIKMWWVTYWVIQNDNDNDFSFRALAKSKDEAIQTVKDGKGIGQFQKPSNLARKFSATLEA